MAIKTVETSIAITDPQGNALANGSITLNLSQPAIVTGGGDIVPTRVTLPLDSTGKISGQPVNLWANDQLSPSGTTYYMRVYNVNGLLVADYGPISIVGAAPIDLSLLTPVVSGSSLSVTNVPFVVARSALTGQTGSVGPFILYTTPTAGLYRVTIYLVVTTGGTGGTVLGTVFFTNEQFAQNTSTATISLAASTTNANFSAPTSVTFYSVASANINWSTTVASATGNPVYAARAYVEFLG